MKGRRALTRWAVLAATVALTAGMTVGAGLPAVAQEAGSLSIQKVADASTVQPGQAFNYTIQVQCSTAAAGGCINAVLTDPLPTYIQLNGPITVTGAAEDPTVAEGPPITITFNDDLGGSTGLLAGQIVTITVPVVVDPTIPPTEDGIPIDNTATIAADNADTKNSTATVVPDVPITISAATTKEFDPTSQIAGDTAVVTMSLTGQTTSNVPVDTLVIQDPVDPTADPNPFDYLEITDVGTPSLPAGADATTTEVFIEPDWVDATGADLSLATGVRYTFTDTDGSGIDPGATGSVVVSLQQRTPPPEPVPADGLQINNVVQTTVDLDGDTADASAGDNFNIRQSEIDVAAGKSIDPNSVNAGETVTVTLTGRNDTPVDAVTPLTTMTITEPDPLANNPFVDGPHPVTFAGFSTGVTWPSGADAATIAYVCSGTPAAAQPIGAPGDIPPPPEACDDEDVTGFSITFTDTDGSGIVSGGEATVPFDIVTDDTQVAPAELPHLNVVLVEGSDDNDNADAARAFDTLITVVDRLDVETRKTVTPGEIPGRPGQIVIVQLQGQVLPYPASSVDATQIIVQDPATVPDPWFEAFSPQSVTATPVPDCATLTVEYTVSTGEPAVWQDVPGLVDIAGPTIVNAVLPDPVPDTATGIRFVYDAEPAGGGCEGGFPPGTTVAPNLTFGVIAGGPADLAEPESAATFTDCADTAAQAPTVDPVVSLEACDEVVVDPVPSDPGQGLDPLEKAWDLDLLNARSQQQSGITISWSTQGYTGLEGVRISDIPDPLGTPLPDSVYDAFDLVRIDPITPAMDPHLTYDQIALTELFVVTDPTDPSTGAWVQAPNDPCPAECDGTYPGYSLDPNVDPETVIGFRLSYIESPTRVDRLDAAAPPVGSGVASSSGNDREIHPVFELRDALRSDDSVPVIASNAYNVVDDEGLPVLGVIDNVVMIEAVFDLDDDEAFAWLDNDTIAIVDVPVGVNSTKAWTGGPIAIPEAGVPPDQYPRTLLTLTGTNTTPAKIDELVITDDTGPDQETFEWFNLAGFTEITPPGDIGADDVTVTLTGLIPTDYTRDEAVALTEAELVDVTQVTVTYTGRININEPAGAGTATVEFGARLREFARSDGATRPTTDLSPLDNQVTVNGADLVDFDIDDPDGFWQGTSTADADMVLVDQGLLVSASKTIVPESQQEPDNSPVTVTIGGQPSGGGSPPLPPPSRAVEMVLIDADPLLWNQYDFVGLDDIVFAAPIDQVQVDALTGGTWELDGDGDPVAAGATWQNGVETTGPALSLPDDVLPEDVQGLRFTFTRVDGANWENPSTPNQTVSFQIQRRENLNIGPGGEIDTVPVPVDLADFNDPAPGETVAGTATNTSTAQASSSDVLPDGSPVTSEVAEATDTIIFRHANNSVQVRKTTDPASNLPPGQPFTYVLTSTNNGDVDITNPVITDYLPVDGDGPIVTLADPPNFTFDIASGTGMPELPALVTVTDNSTDPTEPTLGFSFPPGSTLPVGATYTITFDAIPRAGFPANTDFVNEFGIVGDRPWDVCDGDPSDGIDPDTGECLAEVTNELSVAGAMSVAKLVQAEGSDELGLTVDPAVPTADPADCVADADGFYARPCVPIAEPGGEIAFRLRFINSGNLDIDRILGIDSLPAVGDTLATVPAIARGSEWQPSFSGERPVLADPTFGTINVWFTTGASTCDAVSPTLADDTAAPPNLLCPDLDWVEWPDGDPLSVAPETVTGLQIEILPADGTVLEPAGTIDVDVTMTAPPFDPDADYTAPQAQPDKITYNTVGTTGRILNDQGAPQSYTLPSEPPRVGATLANGPVRVLKVVTGDAARWAPDAFPATLTCVSVGEDVPLGDAADLILTTGEPQVINNLPWGADCTLTEVGNQGQTSVSSTTVTVGRDDQLIRTATLTNVYDDAPLTIEKVVDSDAVDQDGTPIEYGPFTVTVRCTFRASQVYADGYGADTPMDFVLANGESVALTGLPVGANCIVTETDDKGATATTITVVAPGGGTTTDGTRAVVPLPDRPTTIEITNVFSVGSTAIEKVVAGNLDAPGAGGPFLVTMTCTLDDESGTRIVFADVIRLGGGAPLTVTVGNLATGAECVFAETGSSGADAITIAPSGGVTVGDGTVATITVTNTYTTGSVSITKVISGSGAAVGATGPFVIRMRCTLADEMGLTTVVYDADVVLGGVNPLSATIGGLPTGAHCDFQETDSRGGIPSISPASGVDVGDGTVVSVTVTNTFQVAPLPPTGGSVGRTLSLAALALALGSFAMVVGHRRRAAQRS